MWLKISGFILRNRTLILVLLALCTGYLAYRSPEVQLSYKFGGILPQSDTTYQEYLKFTEEFSEDGNILVIGTQKGDLTNIDDYKAWCKLADDLKAITVSIDSGGQTNVYSIIDSVFSIANLYRINRDDSMKRFTVQPIAEKAPTTQAELDAYLEKVNNYPFYDKLLYNKRDTANLMMLFVNLEVFNSDKRVAAIPQIHKLINDFQKERYEIFVSGLPFIRSVISNKVKQELGIFVVLAIVVTGLLLFMFFKSFRVVFFSLMVVIIGVVWSTGIIAMFGFKLSVLMGLIPPLMIVIGIPNCVFLLNKYHSEFKIHGNKIKALSRVIQKVGNATLMTNCTTAVGFATFTLTTSPILSEFGVIASLCILVTFLLSITLIPILFSLQPAPKLRHLKHLDRSWLYATAEKLVNIVMNHRRKVYATTIVMVIIGFVGVSYIKVTGNLVDDLPSDDPVLTNLRFFENHFDGVMPFEMLIETKKPGRALKSATLKRVEELQDTLDAYPEFAKSLSVVNALKFVKQSFYNDLPSKYSLMNRSESRFILPYLKNSASAGGKGIFSAFVDSTQSKLRVTTQMKDIGTLQMASLMEGLKPKIDSILSPDDYKVTLTGTSIVFLKGTNYLVENLFTSLALAMIVIAGLMALLFSSWRMVVISFVPNLIPLILTASIMGYYGISIKPSTILVFSIAFGISVDDTIHFLAKYRQELKMNHWNIKVSVQKAVRETGVSMIYTSIILFFGFGVFCASGFGGTQALGVLVSLTLLFAMLTNLLVLPSLLLSLEKFVTTQAFKEPFIEILDEEEDIDLSDLRVDKTTAV
jgi:predicted RND superfamily exporter protein